MRAEVLIVANDYIAELEVSYPEVKVELFDEQTYDADAWIRVKCASQELVMEIMETVGDLTTLYYMDRGVYIQASASYTGPIVD